MIQRTVKSEVIGITKEAYFYLRDTARTQSGYNPLTEEQKERSWKRIPKYKGELKEVDNDSFGVWLTERTFKAWSVQEIREMLSENGFEWVELGTRESIAVYI